MVVVWIKPLSSDISNDRHPRYRQYSGGVGGAIRLNYSGISPSNPATIAHVDENARKLECDAKNGHRFFAIGRTIPKIYGA